MELTGNIFVTGGAGYLGSALIQRAHDEHWPCRFTVYSRDAHKHAALINRWPDVSSVIGDIADRTQSDRLTLAMLGHDTVIHAAAFKFVDLSESNVWECVRVNMAGSAAVAESALAAGIKQVVGISTDKACHPVNTYGMTKLAMERLFQEANTWHSETRFHLTRYGNVLAATGSMIQDWKRKLKEQGYVNATDPNMSRFWLSVDQAVDLILLALTEPPGTITIPKLPSLTMKEMETLLLPPGTRVTYDGMRPGEKRYEELLTEEEAPHAEDCGDHFRLYSAALGWRKPSAQPYSSRDASEMSPEALYAIVGGPIQ